MILGIFSLPLRGSGGSYPPGPSNYLTLSLIRLTLSGNYLVLNA